jgi:D-sedoheptulose 7-phosphate isomerase
LDLDKLDQFCQQLESLRDRGDKMILCGNGGSASTAGHFVNDFSIGTRSIEKPFNLMSLTDNTAVITAIGNDFGYDQIFKKQLETYLNSGDVVVVISASGNSENLIKAVDYAKSKGSFTIGLLGFDGGKLKDIVDLDIMVTSAKGDYGPVEDAHLVINHLMMNYFLRQSRDESRANAD